MGHRIDSTTAVRYSALFPEFESNATVAMIEHEPLGEDSVADLILLNYKCADFVGHKYGPNRRNSASLAEMDRQVARVLSALEAKVGKDYLLAVSADQHAVVTTIAQPPALRDHDRRPVAREVRSRNGSW
jgi:hypothetical protein